MVNVADNTMNSVKFDVSILGDYDLKKSILALPMGKQSSLQLTAIALYYATPNEYSCVFYRHTFLCAAVWVSKIFDHKPCHWHSLHVNLKIQRSIPYFLGNLSYITMTKNQLIRTVPDWKDKPLPHNHRNRAEHCSQIWKHAESEHMFGKTLLPSGIVSAPYLLFVTFWCIFLNSPAETVHLKIRFVRDPSKASCVCAYAVKCTC